MAFIDVDSHDSVKFASFYNLNEAVGFGGKNMVEDVKIVQFFLQRYFTAVDSTNKPWGEMVPDGKCGPITRAWITRFQIEMRQSGENVMVDGVMDKANNQADNRIGSISKTGYAIRFLNNVCRKGDTEVYKNLTTHPVVPSDLKLIFLQIQAAGPPMNYAKS